jgi:hypothetical protein
MQHLHSSTTTAWQQPSETCNGAKKEQGNSPTQQAQQICHVSFCSLLDERAQALCADL